MTDLQIANMLADYHKECEAAETLREKADVQLKHARLIQEALRQPPVSGQSEQLKALMHFAEFAKEEYGLHIPLNLIKEYVKAFNCH